MSDSIPLSVPSLQGNEWLYVKECLDTEWVSTAGKYVDLFEQKITEYTGIDFTLTKSPKIPDLIPDLDELQE